MKSFLRLSIVFLVAGSLLASCAATRRKNRCNTCPVWKDEVEVVTQ